MTPSSQPGSPPGVLIHLDDARVVLSGALILSGVSLDITAGEVVSVIGPSGCGKTTLLNVVAGLVPLTSGTALAAGKPITGPGPDRTVVFQEDAVFPWMRVGGNVEYALRLRGVPKAERRATVAELLALVGLAGRERLYPRQLSGGMRKRVDLARAFAARPRVLLMDEPYAALDQMTKQRLQQEFRTLVRREGTTAMFVTHDLEEAIFVADRILVMSAGPGSVAAIHEVPFGPDREPGLRMTPEFQRLRRTISDAIEPQEQEPQEQERESQEVPG